MPLVLQSLADLTVERKKTVASVSGSGLPARDRIAGDYQYRALHGGHPIQRAWHAAKLELIGMIAPPPVGGLVLDAGCGSGVISNFLASLGATVVGVDLNREAVDFARRTFSRNNVEFVQASIVEYQRQGFEMIYLLECLEHFPRGEVRRLLRHLRKITALGGRMLATTPNYRSAWPLIEGILDFFELTPRLRASQHLSPMTPARLREHLDATGWRILEMGSFNGVAPFLAPVSRSLTSWFRERELRRRTGLHRSVLYALCEAVPE